MNETMIAKGGANEKIIRLYKRLEISTKLFCVVGFVFDSLYSENSTYNGIGFG